MISGVLLVLALVAGALWYRSRQARANVPPRRTLAIAAPRLGVLRFSEAAGRLWDVEDRPALAPFFVEVQESDARPPQCDVLLIYGDLDVRGRFAGTSQGLREIIRDAGAKVVVVASENPTAHYIAAGRQTGYGRANLVMTLARKEGALPRFLSGVFTAMRQGTSMPEAWARLAPQVPGAAHAGAPDAIFACEAGDVVFRA